MYSLLERQRLLWNGTACILHALRTFLLTIYLSCQNNWNTYLCTSTLAIYLICQNICSVFAIHSCAPSLSRYICWPKIFRNVCKTFAQCAPLFSQYIWSTKTFGIYLRYICNIFVHLSSRNISFWPKCSLYLWYVIAFGDPSLKSHSVVVISTAKRCS